MIVGFPLVDSQLVTSIFQTKHPHVSVETKLIRAMLTFNLPIVPGGGYLNSLVVDGQFQQCLLKKRLVLGFCDQQCIGEFRAIIRLHQANRECGIFNELQ